MKTFTGAMLESVSTILSNADTATEVGDLTWAVVEVSGAEDFMLPAEDRVKRLQEVVSAYTKAAKAAKTK